MRKQILIFTGSAVFLGVSIWALVNLTPKSKDPSAEVPSSQIETKQVSLQPVAEGRATVPQTADIVSNETTQAKPEQIKNDAGAGLLNQITEAVQTVTAQEAEKEITALKFRLHLTDEQVETIRSLIKERDGQIFTMMQKMWSDQLGRGMDVSKEESKTAATQMIAMQTETESKLKQLLSLDQQTEYDKYKTEQKQAEVEASAYDELTEIQPLLQLSEPQKDQVFNVIYQHQQKRAARYPIACMYAPETEWDTEQRSIMVEALRKILSPEQIQAYETFTQSVSRD